MAIVAVNWLVRAACILLPLVLSVPAPAADGSAVEFAVSTPMSGDEISYGREVLQGVQLAIDEANAAGIRPQIKLDLYDDKGDTDEARSIATQIVSGHAVALLGPVFSKQSLEAGPIYGSGDLVSLATTCTSDLITQNPTTFRVLFKNSDQGEMLAFYLSHVLGQRSADVIAVDDGYGQTLLQGFRDAAPALGIEAKYWTFKTQAEAEQAVEKVAADPAKPPIVLLTLDADGARILTTLRRRGMSGPFLGGDAFGDDFFARHFVDEPEEKKLPGFFTDNTYGISPVILDSANAEILAFADRFKSRFHHVPDWQAVAGYDSAKLAVQAVQALGPDVVSGANTKAARLAVLDYLNHLTDPVHAHQGLLGPFAFDANRSRAQAIRIVRFHSGHSESAPLQIVPVAVPDSAELASGAVFSMDPGRYARIQRVVYTGIFVNEIPRVDVAQSSFTADFYLWLRYAAAAGPGASDPTDIIFPNMVSGSFDRAHPAEERATDDGTTYRLWRVRGTFRNDYDLHLFPFDQQRLKLSAFNSRAAFERIVYVLDRRSSTLATPSASPLQTAASGPFPAQAATSPAPRDALSIADPVAFRDLTQWRPVAAQELRDNMVTDSDLGDPARMGSQGNRELSGFQLNVDVSRRVLATLAKSLLPLILMTAIMFASLFFPHGLVKEKITVAVTAALSGAVLLTAINAQLGGVGYTVAVEYAFYIFFALSTLCILSVLLAERLRVAGRAGAAAWTEQTAKLVFLAGVLVVGIGAAMLWH
jgi:ABC-type branched-subunit amino acid transport system substrate-binding protein